MLPWLKLILHMNTYLLKMHFYASAEDSIKLNQANYKIKAKCHL